MNSSSRVSALVFIPLLGNLARTYNEDDVIRFITEYPRCKDDTIFASVLSEAHERISMYYAYD